MLHKDKYPQEKVVQAVDQDNEKVEKEFWILMTMTMMIKIKMMMTTIKTMMMTMMTIVEEDGS